jgi:hypothetical protein
MVGANGFEPSTSWSRTRRASQAALRPDWGALSIELEGAGRSLAYAVRGCQRRAFVCGESGWQVRVAYVREVWWPPRCSTRPQMVVSSGAQ